MGSASIIADKKILRDYHSILHRLTGLVIDFVTAEGDPLKLSTPDNFNPFCSLVMSCPEGKAACESCARNALATTQKTGEGVVYPCHAGLIDIAVPLFLNKKFVGCLSTGQILLSPPTEESFQETLEKLRGMPLDQETLREAYFNTPVMSEEKIQALMDLIALIGNYVVESESKLLFLAQVDETDKIATVKRYVQAHYQERISVEDIAHVACLSPSHFSHLFKKEVGVSFVQYLNRYRIDKARELLIDTRLSITEIAFASGFQSLPHFNRIFKKIMGATPSSIRQVNP